MRNARTLARWGMLLALGSPPGTARADGEPPAAPPTTTMPPPPPEARRIEQQARAAAQAGQCETARYELARLSSVDPARHAEVRAEPAALACAAHPAGDAAAAAARAALAARAEALAARVGRGRVRVRTADRSVVGTFAGSAEGALLVDAGGPAPAKLPLEAVRGVELSTGVRSRAAAGLGWGLLAGATLGVIATVALGRGGDEDDYFLEYTLLPPVVVGSLVGLVVGVALTGERWEPVARW